jgi:hypothetical protein
VFPAGYAEEKKRNLTYLVHYIGAAVGSTFTRRNTHLITTPTSLGVRVVDIGTDTV